MAVVLGEFDYRAAAFDRLNEAGLLLNADSYAGCVYLAGRAVECMLRAMIWRTDSEIRAGKKSLDTGHDLRQLFTKLCRLGFFNTAAQAAPLEAQLTAVAGVWFNNMRFISNARLKTSWWRNGVTSKKKTLKRAVTEHYDRCVKIVKHCEALCEN